MLPCNITVRHVGGRSLAPLRHATKAVVALAATMAMVVTGDTHHPRRRRPAHPCGGVHPQLRRHDPPRHPHHGRRLVQAPATSPVRSDRRVALASDDSAHGDGPLRRDHDCVQHKELTLGVEGPVVALDLPGNPCCAVNDYVSRPADHRRHPDPAAGPTSARRSRPKPVWLWTSTINAASADVDRWWQAFLRRFDLEHTFDCSSKPWAGPARRSGPGRGRPPDLADHHRAHPLHLARPLVADLRRPWERPAALHVSRQAAHQRFGPHRSPADPIAGASPGARPPAHQNGAQVRGWMG